jgi:hypothetical protein
MNQKKWCDSTCHKLSANALKGLNSAQDKNLKQILSISYNPPKSLWCSLELGLISYNQFVSSCNMSSYIGIIIFKIDKMWSRFNHYDRQ